MPPAPPLIWPTVHPIPSLQETLDKLNGSKVFSKIDLIWGYHQVELHSKSRNITAFQDNRGLYRFTRLIFGVKSASEIYNETIKNSFANCPGVVNIYDNIVVHGKNEKEHDANLEIFLEKMATLGLTANRKKCLFRVPQIEFFGFCVSSKDIMPTSKL